MYINELSLLETNLNKYDVRRVLTNFVELYASYHRLTKFKKLFLHNAYVFEFINCEHKIASWLNDPEVDIEEKRLVSSINQHISYFTGIDEVEMKIDRDDCKSAGIVCLEESILLSLTTNDKWNRNELEGTYSYLDSDGELITDVIKIPNVALKEHLETKSVSEIIAKKYSILPISYSELWEKRELYFPSLVFCESVEDNFGEMEKAYYKQVLKKLIELETYFSKWDGKSFNKNEILNASPESESTLNEYKNQHEFFAPNDKKYLANWHVRFTGIAGRIFFEPYFEDKKCLICYIGKKLPNKSYPT